MEGDATKKDRNIMEPYLLIKAGDSLKDIPNSVLDRLINSIDLCKLSQWFVSLDTAKWVPRSYWSKVDTLKSDRHIGELMWGIYSYLIEGGFLVVEDRYYGYNSSRLDRYIRKDSYYNPLEGILYDFIIKRLVNEGYLISSSNERYIISRLYFRQINLNKLLS